MKKQFITLVFLIFHAAVFGQSISDLKEKKQKAAREIEYTTKLLDEARKIEQTSLNRLRLINNKITQRNLLISGINAEVDLFQQFIDDNNLVVKLLNNDIEMLKKEYALMIQASYRNRNSSDKILFLLSADDFNQAYRRFLYIKRYTNYRRQQAQTIESVQLLLDKTSEKLEQQKAQKQKLIEENVLEKQRLAGEQSQKNYEIQKLKQQQQSLRQKLNEQRKIEQELEREIQRIIEEEARKNQASGKPGFALTPEQKLVGDNFEQNKNRLPWPVKRGIITEHFGIHKHPVLSNVEIRNNGINIATEIGAKVRTVFNGEVSRVFGISGGNTAVIIRHGNYLTVYSNLREVVVKKGDLVSTKQTIGTVFTDTADGNKSILKFQIWRENTKLDPEQWIVK